MRKAGSFTIQDETLPVNFIQIMMMRMGNEVMISIKPGLEWKQRSETYSENRNANLFGAK